MVSLECQNTPTQVFMLVNTHKNLSGISPAVNWTSKSKNNKFTYVFSNIIFFPSSSSTFKTRYKKKKKTHSSFFFFFSKHFHINLKWCPRDVVDNLPTNQKVPGSISNSGRIFFFQTDWHMDQKKKNKSIEVRR